MRLSQKILMLANLFTSVVGTCAPAGYLFVTFKHEKTALSEQIHFSLSEDGRTWQALNNGEPVLVSDLGEKGVRDPFLLRAPDSKTFFLIATDLSIYHNSDWTRAVRAGSRALIIWESHDLLEWSAPRRVEVAPPDVGCTWAPEAIYDEAAGNYLVFWASTTGRDDFAKHRIWAARTEDFKTFGQPFVYIDQSTATIDTTIVQDAERYYRFTKDEKHNAITMEAAPALNGPWSDVSGFNLAGMVGYEGPACYLVEPATADKPAVWCLILDHYAMRAGYQPYLTTDLSSGHFEPAEGFHFPYQHRHGSVLPLNPEEFDRIRAADTPNISNEKASS